MLFRSSAEVANTVWNFVNTLYPGNASSEYIVSQVLRLLEADEEFTANTATKRDKDTDEVLLVKNVGGVELANTINMTSP